MKIWTQKYTVWNSIIDIQHKSLFDLAKEIYFIKNNHVSINEVRMLSIEFLKQLKDHAKYEEKYMKRI
ncbi:TPA: hemerythrin family non-heme iron protein, partial [Campylobacter lari]|nr:hemerythrin family non-heme iron protein [Campylobacter lari]